MSDEAKKPLGRILLQQRALTQAELDEALARSTPGGAPLASRLIESGTLSELAALKALSEQSGVPGIDLNQICLRLADLAVMPREVAVKHVLLPVLVRDDRIFIAMAAPTDQKIIDEIEFVSGKRVFPYVALQGPLAKAIAAAYDLRDRGEEYLVGPACPPEVLRKLGLAASHDAALASGAKEVSAEAVRDDPRAEQSGDDLFQRISHEPEPPPVSVAAPRPGPPPPSRRGRSSPPPLPPGARRGELKSVPTDPGVRARDAAKTVPREAAGDRSQAATVLARDAMGDRRSSVPAAAEMVLESLPASGSQLREINESDAAHHEESARDTAPPPPGYPGRPEVSVPRPAAIPVIVDDAMGRAIVTDEVTEGGFGDETSAVVELSAVAMKDGARTVLIADEDAETRRVLRQALEGRGFRVVEAPAGLATLRIVKEQTPHVMILDAMLPEVHGFDIARRVKGSERYGHIPIVMTSSTHRGWRFAEDVRAGYGVAAFLEKPLRADEVVKAVEAALLPKAGAESASPPSDPASISAEAERLLAAGIAAYQAGDVDKAIDQLIQGTRVDPLAFRIHFHLGLLFGKKGQLFDAIQELETAIEINGTSFSALKNLAVVYQKAGFRNKAIETWERALGVAPDEPTRLSIKEHLVRLL